MKIGESMGVLHSFALNYVKYTNVEGFAEAITYSMAYVLLFQSYFVYICMYVTDNYRTSTHQYAIHAKIISYLCKGIYFVCFLLLQK